MRRSVHARVFFRALAGDGRESIMGCTLMRGGVCTWEFFLVPLPEAATSKIWDVHSAEAECTRGSFYSCLCRGRLRRNHGMHTQARLSAHAGVFTRALAGGGHELIMGCTLARSGVHTREFSLGPLSKTATSKKWDAHSAEAECARGSFHSGSCRGRHNDRRKRARCLYVRHRARVCRSPEQAVLHASTS